MTKVVVTALLLSFGVTLPAVADDLSDRFKEDFGDIPPALGVPPDAKSNSIVVPRPRLRRPYGIAQTSAPPENRALPLVPASASGAAAPHSPAATALNLPETIRDQYKVGISWNPVDPSWDGMFVTNSGEKPFAVLGIEFNSRKDCELKPYSLTKIRKFIDLPQAIKKWGQRAINLFGLPKMETDSVLVPDLPDDLQSVAVRPEEPKIRASGRIPIFNGTKCDKVVEAIVDTDVGPVSVQFKRPYTGH